MKERDSINIC